MGAITKSPREKAIEALKQMSEEEFNQQKDKLSDEKAEDISSYLESLTWTERTQEQIQDERDWSAINKASENEAQLFRKMLADLVTYIQPPDKSGKGRNGVDFRDMLFAICLKEYLGKSYRSIKGELETAQSQGFISETCCFSTYTNYKKKETVQDALQELITLSGTPLEGVENVYAVDATGFSDSRFGKWKDYKYESGKKGDKHRLWKKLHVCCGTKTNIVTAATVTKGTANDNTQFKELIERTDEYFTGDRVTADKAYMARDNYDQISDLGMRAVIPFQSNATEKARGCMEWKRMYHVFHNREGRFKNMYHKRSNVESTFNAIKQRFGKSLNCRDEDALETELLAKVLCYNICAVIRAMYEIDLAIDFN